MAASRTRSWDTALGVLGAIALLTEGFLQSEPGLGPVAVLLALATAAPLAWRSRAPLAVLLAVELGAVACVLAFHASWSSSAIVMVMLYTVALHGDRQRSVVIGTATAILVVITILLIDGTVDLGGIATRLPLVVLSLALGDMIRSRRALQTAARERDVRDARAREEDSRRRIADERLRIARELHDTLAHALVAINVRAGVAERLQDSQDPSAALADIKAVSATALRDLRATLTLLREPDDTVPTGPAYDLAAIPGLVDHARAAGLQADVAVQGDKVAVPSSVGQVAFRIVQEALTNVLRHAEASSAHVRLRTLPDALDIEVTDDGRANTGGHDPGHGLRGMNERVLALGGRVHTGPRREGGWCVHAVLPFTGGDSP